MSEYEGLSSLPQMEPPQVQAPYAPPEGKPVWPIVIGVISVIFGAIGIISVPVGLMISARGPATDDLRKYFPPQFMSFTRVDTVVGLAVSALLLAAGISLLKRRRVTRGLHTGYAIVNICRAVLTAVLTMTMVFPAVRDAAARGEIEGALPVIIVAGAIGGLLSGMAYPVFLLIWFGRSKIARQVRQWGVG